MTSLAGHTSDSTGLGDRTQRNGLNLDGILKHVSRLERQDMYIQQRLHEYTT